MFLYDRKNAKFCLKFLHKPQQEKEESLMLTAFILICSHDHYVQNSCLFCTTERRLWAFITFLGYILAIDLSSCNITITSFGSLHHVISVFVPDKVLWAGLLCSVIQLTYVFKYVIVIALASDVRIARLTAVKWTSMSDERLKCVSL